MESKLKIKKQENISEPIELHDWFARSREIRMFQDKNGYWLFDSRRIKEADPMSGWVKEIKPLRLGVNEFEGDFVNGHYLMRVEVFKTQIRIWLYQGDWKGFINADAFPFFKRKTFCKDEKGAIITPQMFAFLEDFGLIKTSKISQK